jgi:hypothetical protein
MNTVRPEKLRRIAQGFRDRFDATLLGDALSKPLAGSLELQAEVMSRSNAPTFDPTRLASKAEALLDLLPEVLSDRFLFDSWILNTTAELIRATFPEFPKLVIPGYDRSGWGHWCEAFVTAENQPFLATVILLSGAESLDDIVLADYPWILHELAHPLRVIADPPLSDGINERVREVMRRRTGQGLADRADAAARNRSASDEIRTHWMIGEADGCWAEEVMADHIALWLGGGSFIAAFVRVVAAAGVRPFEMTDQHPPYALRAAALIASASELSLGSEANELASIARSWSSQTPSGAEGARYRELCDGKFAEACRQGTLARLKKIQLPCPWAGDDQRSRLSTEWENGLDMILAAHREAVRNPKSYPSWEREVVLEVTAELKQ